MSPEDRLEALGLELPPPPQPVGSYTRAVRAGGLIFTAGQVPMTDGAMVFSGKVGRDLTVAEGYEAARLCALNVLSVLKAEVGRLDKVARLVRLTGYVCSADGFSEQAAVLNGASELFGEVLQERGLHARLAIGVVQLPLNAAVEIEVIGEIDSSSE